MKPVIHFAHANGIPSQTYQPLFDALSDQYEVIYVPLLGINELYPVDDQWKLLTQQVIDSIELQNQGQQVIAVGHSLGALLSYQAAQLRPDLIKQVIMLDPPLIMGTASLALHLAKYAGSGFMDKFTPAGLSARRRDHWQNREDAAIRLRQRGFFKEFDQDCFDAYIRYGLCDDLHQGGVTLTIPKRVEVEIFRKMPSLWWLPGIVSSKVTVDQVVGNQSPFLKQKNPQKAQKKLGITYHLVEGGHMFPLQYPKQTVQTIKQLIK
ncbi:alpha/beta hydrolase [Acinetobacter qingfengensis]|uniref:Hydrolase n=1 Tax=Acinetobacter qingfengensis TaxID=1262585 RepID=A0A1E7RFX2_9GAMM|nr:alpha/beta hydrolase [Acinetobacter qingfengensis]KAA8731821.1 alpha/beta hydrolase [Acinetobacter qingfengensis]OEY98055.1 hydrolase [Acinetobacter qingfengensis]